MTDVQGLPEHHRAYIYARVAVLAEDTSTDALDASVRRGFTDAEELRMRDRRYLTARGTVIERGEDLAVLDAHVEELLDHRTEGDNPPAGPPQAAAGAEHPGSQGAGSSRAGHARLRGGARPRRAANTGTAGGAPGRTVRRPAVRTATHRRPRTARSLRSDDAREIDRFVRCKWMGDSGVLRPPLLTVHCCRVLEFTCRTQFRISQRL